MFATSRQLKLALLESPLRDNQPLIFFRYHSKPVSVGDAIGIPVSSHDLSDPEEAGPRYGHIGEDWGVAGDDYDTDSDLATADHYDFIDIAIEEAILRVCLTCFAAVGRDARGCYARGPIAWS